MRSSQGHRGPVRHGQGAHLPDWRKVSEFPRYCRKGLGVSADIPLFVSEIRSIFERWQLAEYLEKARQTEPFDPSLYDDDDDPEEIEMERKDDIRRSANDLLLVEWAKELLLNEDGSTG